MPGDFFSSLSKPSLAGKILLAIAILAIAARLFALAYMPDPSMTDSLYHLTISRYIIQNNAIPFDGIPGTGVEIMPVPLYHLIVAVPFMLLPLSLTLETVRVFPILFSVLQLVFSFLIMRKVFPKHWHIGFAFAAVHPLLIIFGSVNMPDTLASVFVLLSFYLYFEFREKTSKAILFIAPFALAAMVLSKENAAILLPVFFLAFLVEVWKKRGKNLKKATVFFLIATVALCSFFLLFRPTGAMQSSLELEHFNFFAESAVLLPLNFNSSFWFFLDQGFSAKPFGISKELAFITFSLITFPITFFLLFGLVKAALKRQAYALLLMACLALSSVLVFLRSDWTIYSRMLLPIMPLLGLGLCQSYKEFSVENWKKLFLIIFSLTAVYCIAFSCLYVDHFAQDHEKHLPLYGFLKELPDESIIALHPNKARAIAFIAGKQYVSYSHFQGLGAEEAYAKLKELNVTHLASTCYKQQWDQQVLKQLEVQGLLRQSYRDSCSTLYEVS